MRHESPIVGLDCSIIAITRSACLVFATGVKVAYSAGLKRRLRATNSPARAQFVAFRRTSSPQPRVGLEMKKKS